MLHRHSVEIFEVESTIYEDNVGWLYNINNVRTAIRNFLNKPGESIFGFFTARLYTLAIMKIGLATYIFNSHSCNANGNHAASGSACIIKFDNCDLNEFNIEKTCSVAEQIYNNLSGMGTYDPNERLSLTRVYCRHLYDNHTAENVVLSEMASSVPSEMASSELFNEEDNNELSLMTSILSINTSFEEKTNNSKTVEGHNEPCDFGEKELIIEIEAEFIKTEINEPNVAESIDKIINHDKKQAKFKLHRETSKPVYSSIEKRLEELCFIKNFPYGRNGYREIREGCYSRITSSAYAKARVMGIDPRFQTAEYLFYILALIEEEKVNAAIRVCSKIRSGNQRVNELNVYTKKLRGLP